MSNHTVGWIVMCESDIIAGLKLENAELRHEIDRLRAKAGEVQVRIYSSLENAEKLKPTLDTIAKDGEIRRLREELERLLEVVGSEDQESIKAVLEDR